jgi:hypothetical protein
LRTQFQKSLHLISKNLPRQATAEMQLPFISRSVGEAWGCAKNSWVPSLFRYICSLKVNELVKATGSSTLVLA